MQWLAEAFTSLGLVGPKSPAPDIEQHRELRLALRREFNEEWDKPAGERDKERVRQLRIQDLQLGMEHNEFLASQLEGDGRNWRTSSSLAACCLGVKETRRRVAASLAARATWFRTRNRQLQAELTAMMEQRPVRIAEVPRIDLPEEVLEEMRAVPAKDLCKACCMHLDIATSQEELLRRNAQADTDVYRKAGMLAEHLAAVEMATEQKEVALAVQRTDALAQQAQQQLHVGGGEMRAVAAERERRHEQAAAGSRDAALHVV